ncbi:DNA-binding protein [Pseudomonas sp. MWU16-30317]|uniref:DNA-binding protein n=1 Tax=Pseudomonas sp. MWU16-30317 TaxID=2878095 RepID=UPI001CFC4013|nr:DNA-binding protein [Pseudomonas sp. MWU16-30317]
MARGGINKALVSRARESLLARGEHPSIDAIRIELGNTGSKSTIHRYLRELDDAMPAVAQGAPVLTDALSTLVANIAQQLRDESQAYLDQAQADLETKAAALQARTQAAETQLDQALIRETVLQSALEQTSERLQVSQSSLQTELTRNARLSQACDDLQLRLDDQQQRVQSLEEQHRHSRDALQHYRDSVREQREQEQRRHEAQVQMIQVEVRQLQQSAVVRQDELTRLNRSNERLLAEAAHSERQLQLQLAAQAAEQALGKRLAEQHEVQLAQQRELVSDWGRRAAQAEGAQAVLQQQLLELAARAQQQVEAAASEAQAPALPASNVKSGAKKRPPSAGRAVRGVSPKD